MALIPEVVTYRITSKCNNRCGYCYGPSRDLSEMNFASILKMFDLLRNLGVNAIVLTGGEPLDRDDIEEIVLELSKFQFRIFLDTNNDTNFQNILRILDFYKGKTKRPILRIGTVVTKQNIDQLISIGNLIRDYPVDIWKIYEYIPQNNAYSNRGEFDVSSTLFDKTVNEIIARFRTKCKIIISRRINRSRAYFFIQSEGNVFMPVDDGNVCREVTIGNIFDHDIFEKWRKFVLEGNYIENVEKTFDYHFQP
ncbi:MAG: radical SAM protein [Candidatus Berkelbacteria bacterium Licking1014_85]|uniref:Radical SAM protein n=1 Tax=Candidatus Berkelbacteria bacterium Licking1014_85 TaxID=2017148 RepID=A0A554LGY7_9BACT|nr:MAG: radical SAM protein [Candidatus Berkelbacteria bacterium Licking1014_85]